MSKSGTHPAVTAPPPPVALVVHGHFYQPPRENPWTDQITREPSAAPFHDWNERIMAECYRANAFARIYGKSETIESLVNNYKHLSFNIGPTLARFIDRVDTSTIARMRAGDEAQIRALGIGGGMAQVWGHPILPLCSPRDRTTQIEWGILDFVRRFGRRPEGMWLPETAADPATLEALIEAGITYTILAPEQIAQVRAPGAPWKPVTRDTVDTGRGYRFVHGDGSGRKLDLAVFDGPLSREIAFGIATRDSESFISTIKSCAERSSATGHRLVLAASDGELYGHHKKFADLMLAHALTVAAPRAGVQVTNLGAFFRAEPPQWEAELGKGPLGEGTAWSCAHGLGRWLRHCGCAMRSPEESGWSQAWRTPLRAGLDLLRDKAAVFFEDVAGELFEDPWAVRNEFGAVIDDAPALRERFLKARGKKSIKKGENLHRALLLMELSRSSLLMYASCGWFFDDVAGIEASLVIRQAAFVMDLWQRLGGRPPVKDVVARFGEARSNLPHAGTGADVFRRVSRHRTTSVEAVAAAAFAAVARAGAGPGTGAGDATLAPGFTVKEASKKVGATTVHGRLTVEHERTGEIETLKYEARTRGAVELSGKVGDKKVTLEALPDELRDPVAFALVERLTVCPKVLPADCRHAIELGRLSASDGPHVDPLFHGLLGKLLARLIDETPADAASEETVGALLDLLAALPEPARFEPQRRVQEWLWLGYEALAARNRQPSAVLRALGDKVGLASK